MLQSIHSQHHFNVHMEKHQQERCFLKNTSRESRHTLRRPIGISNRGQRVLGWFLLCQLQSLCSLLLHSSPSPLSHLLKCSNIGSSPEERFLLSDVKISAEQKPMGSMALLRPTAEKSVLLFYSCGTISFFLNPYYFYPIKFS